jgi:hypothetical protein
MITKGILIQKLEFRKLIKNITIGLAIAFFIFTAFYFIFLNIYMKNIENKRIEGAYYMLFAAASVLLLLTALSLLFGIVLRKMSVHDFLNYAKLVIFKDGKIGRSQYIKLLGISEENLRDIGFNYVQKEFTFEDFEKGYRNLVRKESKKDIRFDIAKIYDDLPF